MHRLPHHTLRLRLRLAAAWCAIVPASCLLALARPAAAEPEHLAHALHPGSRPAARGDHEGPRSEARVLGGDVQAEAWRKAGAARALERVVRLELPRYGWFGKDGATAWVDQVALRRLPPGSLVVEHAGLHAFALRHIERRLRAAWRDTIRDRWEAGIDDDDAMRQRFVDMGDALADFDAGGAWGARSWLASRRPEDGGAPRTARVHTVGERIEVLRLGPISLTNELKGKIDRVAAFGLDPGAGPLVRPLPTTTGPRARAAQARDDARLERARGPQADEVGEDVVDLAAPPPRPAPSLRLFLEPTLPGARGEGAAWRLRVQPSARLRLANDPLDVVRDVSLRATLQVATGASDRPTVEVEAVVRYRPAQREAIAALEVTLLQW